MRSIGEIENHVFCSGKWQLNKRCWSWGININPKRKNTAKLKLIQITDKMSQKITGGPEGRVLQAMALRFLLSSLQWFNKMFKGKRMMPATLCRWEGIWQDAETGSVKITMSPPFVCPSIFFHSSRVRSQAAAWAAKPRLLSPQLLHKALPGEF